MDALIFHMDLIVKVFFSFLRHSFCAFHCFELIKEL